MIGNKVPKEVVMQSIVCDLSISSITSLARIDKYHYQELVSNFKGLWFRKCFTSDEKKLNPAIELFRFIDGYRRFFIHYCHMRKSDKLVAYRNKLPDQFGFLLCKNVPSLTRFKYAENAQSQNSALTTEYNAARNSHQSKDRFIEKLKFSILPAIPSFFVHITITNLLCLYQFPILSQFILILSNFSLIVFFDIICFICKGESIIFGPHPTRIAQFMESLLALLGPDVSIAIPSLTGAIAGFIVGNITYSIITFLIAIHTSL